jgi:hypothetical protein
MTTGSDALNATSASGKSLDRLLTNESIINITTTFKVRGDTTVINNVSNEIKSGNINHDENSSYQLINIQEILRELTKLRQENLQLKQELDNFKQGTN